MKIYKGIIIETTCNVCNLKFTKGFKKDEIKSKVTLVCPTCFSTIKVKPQERRLTDDNSN